jgi:2-polyprenyl-3-methyl-5-hydroxy-6-metoxy-1,4-benzoquinol methylase
VSSEVLRTEKCYVCQSENLTKVQDRDGFMHLICNDCLLKRVHPDHLVPSTYAYTDAYFNGTMFHQTAGRIGYNENYADPSTSHRTTNYNSYIKKIIRYCGVGQMERLRILDFGCGYGVFLRTVAQQMDGKVEVQGVEIDPEVCKKATLQLAGAKVYCVDLKVDTGVVPRDYFDVITMLDVIEHLDDPRVYLQRLAECADTSGYLLLSTPNIESLNARLYGDRWILHGAPYHTYYFGPRSIRILLEQTGWKVETIFTERTIFHNEHYVTETWRGQLIRALFQNQFWDYITNKLVRTGSIMIVIAKKQSGIAT